MYKLIQRPFWYDLDVSYRNIQAPAAKLLTGRNKYSCKSGLGKTHVRKFNSIYRIPQERFKSHVTSGLQASMPCVSSASLGAAYLELPFF